MTKINKSNFVPMDERPRCSEEGCNNAAQKNGKYYAKQCWSCGKGRLAKNRVIPPIHERPFCKVEGCTDRVTTATGCRKDGTAYLRKKCWQHIQYDLAIKRGFNSITELVNSRSPYRKHRKTYCENIDGRLGFVCTTTILDEAQGAQLDVDHRDGNKKNNNDENLQTLCASCHRYKTWKEKDTRSAKRKDYKRMHGIVAEAL